MEQHFVVCDRCKKTVKMIRPNFSIIWISPKGWSSMGKIDYCPECAKAYKKYREAFE